MSCSIVELAALLRGALSVSAIADVTSGMTTAGELTAKPAPSSLGHLAVRSSRAGLPQASRVLMPAQRAPGTQGMHRASPRT